MKKVIMLGVFLFFVCFNLKVTASNTSSYCVIEASSKRIIKENNSDTQSLIASTAKIMTALVALKNVDIFEYVEVDLEDQNMIGSKIYLEDGDVISYIDLIYGLMLRSGNDAANAVARATFYDMDKFVFNMNEEAKRINMINTVFANATGLDEAEYNLSTSYDMCLLMIEAMKNDYFREITSTTSYKTTTLNNKTYSWSNKHKLIKLYDEFIGGKTGYTKKSGRVLVSYVVKNDMEYAIVTINNSNDWNFHKTIADSLTDYNDFKVLKKGVYDTFFDDFDYYFINYSDIYIPYKKEEEISVVIKVVDSDVLVIFYANDEFICSYVGYLINKYNLDVSVIKELYI